MPAPMRTAIYARKSTESEERQVQSLDDQIRELKALAKRERLHVFEVFQESKSAKEPGNRPEFNRLVAEIQKGEVDAVLTWSIDRLARNPVDGGQIAYLLQTGKLGLIRSPERSYRPEDNAMLMSIETGIATAYIQNLRRNVMRGMRGKVERGWHTCKAPVGYLNDPITREIVPDPERFDIVRRAWEMVLGGTNNVMDVHREMTALGLTTSRRKATPTKISAAGLYTMFSNRFYLGEITFKKDRHPGRHKPMVTEEEFLIVQDILYNRRKKSQPKRIDLPFAGSMRCGQCGCAIVGEKRTKHYPRTGRVAHYVYYHCSGSTGCSKKSVRAEDLLAEVERKLLHLTISKETGEWLKYALEDSFEREAVDNAVDSASISIERDRQEKRLKKLTQMRLDDEISADELRTERSAILSNLDEIGDELRKSRERTGRMMRLSRQRIQGAVRAGELLGIRRDPTALAQALRVSGGHVLNLSPFEFRLDPIIEKITGFELLRDGSESPKRGDFVPLNSIWWTLVRDIRKLLTEENMCGWEREEAKRKRRGRYSWRPGYLREGEQEFEQNDEGF